MNAHGLEGFNQDLRKCEGKLIFTQPLWYLIGAQLRDLARPYFAGFYFCYFNRQL